MMLLLVELMILSPTQLGDGNGGTSTATVNVTISDGGDVEPEAQNDSAETTQGDAVTINVLDNDTSNSGSNQFNHHKCW